MAWIRTWDANPRRDFDPAGIAELAQSIAQDGLQQPIVVRFLGEKTAESGETLPDLQIVAGERRFLACQQLGLPTIPARVRVGLFDREAMRLALIENLQRRDLNAMEEANGYRALLDAGYTQSEIATQIGVDPSTISNALRLLKLPESIQQMVVEGQLSPTHARALLRFEGFADVQAYLATKAVERNLSAKFLETGIPLLVDLENAGLIMSLSPYRTRFDREVCQQCPFGAMRKSDMDAQYCLRPEHWRELEAEAQAKIDAEMAAKRARLEQAKMDAEARKNAGVGDVPDSAPKPPGTKEKGDSEASGETLLRLRDLAGEGYAYVSSAPPAGCTENCPCRLKAIGWDNVETQVCLDPKRYEKLRQANESAAKKAVALRLGEAKAEIVAKMPKSADDPQTLRALSTLLWPFVLLATVKSRRAIAARMPKDSPIVPILNQNLNKHSDFRADYLQLFEGLGIAGMVAVTLEVRLVEEAGLRQYYPTQTLPLCDYYMGADFARNLSAPSEETEPAEETPEAASTEAVNGFLGDPSAVRVCSPTPGTEPVPAYYGDPSAWAAVADQGEDAEREVYCACCDECIPSAELDSPQASVQAFRVGAADERRFVSLKSGVLIAEVEEPEYFCPKCAEEQQAAVYCRECGRMNSEMSEGCWWSQLPEEEEGNAGLCSHCAGEPAEQDVSPRFLPGHRVLVSGSLSGMQKVATVLDCAKNQVQVRFEDGSIQWRPEGFVSDMTEAEEAEWRKRPAFVIGEQVWVEHADEPDSFFAASVDDLGHGEDGAFIRIRRVGGTHFELVHWERVRKWEFNAPTTPPDFQPSEKEMAEVG